jgi:hypothetical protein
VPLSLEETPTEAAAGLDTKTVEVFNLMVNEYVLLAVDVEQDDAPLFIAADYAEPVLWRVASWPEDNETTSVIRLDRPDGVYFEVSVGPEDFMRLVLPGQDHEIW